MALLSIPCFYCFKSKNDLHSVEAVIQRERKTELHEVRSGRGGMYASYHTRANYVLVLVDLVSWWSTGMAEGKVTYGNPFRNLRKGECRSVKQDGIES